MRTLFALLLFCYAVIAQAVPTVDDVQKAVNRGDYAAAETMMHEVVAARPESAKAHYIYAEILAHQGRTADAVDQARTARRLDPDIHFTTREKFRQFETELAAASRGHGNLVRDTTTGTDRTTSDRTTSDKPERSSGSGFSTGFWWLVVLGIGALWFFFRRRPAAPGAGYGGLGGNPQPPPPPGSGGYPYGAVPPNQGSGMGRTVAAGLGGLAAGMVAEHLIERAMDSRHDGGHGGGMLGSDANAASNDADEALRDRPIDFGSGNDWSGGDSGGGGGGGDSGGGFDSGGGNDW